MKTFLSFLLLLLPALPGRAQDTLNTMFYNVYRFPTAPPQGREHILGAILAEYRPDLFMVCELASEKGADLILDSALQNSSHDFARATFWYNHSEPADTLQQMVFYNTRKLELAVQAYWPTPVRDINQYTFRLRNGLSDTVWLEVFVTHLKSGTGAANRKLRAAMADTFKKVLAQLPPERHILFAGDFNLYSSSEPAYLTLTNTTGPVTMVDPLNRPGAWSDDTAFRDIHTQATRLSAAGFGIGGATGGMDDRFDFILMSENCRTAQRLFYVEDSYHAFGNNGNCFDRRIDDTACSGPYPFALRRNLHNMSDHTPVVMQLAYPSLPLALPAGQQALSCSLPLGNIVTDQLIVLAEFEGQEALQLYICNTLGQVLKQQRPGKGGRKINVIDVYDLPPGLYFLHLRAGNASHTLKFVKR